MGSVAFLAGESLQIFLLLERDAYVGVSRVDYFAHGGSLVVEELLVDLVRSG